MIRFHQTIAISGGFDLIFVPYAEVLIRAISAVSSTSGGRMDFAYADGGV
jgi:hypothetical protein